MIQEKILHDLHEILAEGKTSQDIHNTAVDAAVYIRSLISDHNDLIDQIDSLKVELARSRGHVSFLKKMWARERNREESLT